jgi:hypothetical protein
LDHEKKEENIKNRIKKVERFQDHVGNIADKWWFKILLLVGIAIPSAMISLYFSWVTIPDWIGWCTAIATMLILAFVAYIVFGCVGAMAILAISNYLHQNDAGDEDEKV